MEKKSTGCTRRDFFKTSGAVGVGALLNPLTAVARMVLNPRKTSGQHPKPCSTTVKSSSEPLHTSKRNITLQLLPRSSSQQTKSQKPTTGNHPIRSRRLLPQASRSPLPDSTCCSTNHSRCHKSRSRRHSSTPQARRSRQTIQKIKAQECRICKSMESLD